jgi:phenylpropionate dioxygenase-like ring-hydroxylating dioxygenase large terminal subunit
MLDELNERSNGTLNGAAASLGPYLEQLVEYASRPLEEAQALPGAYYTNEALYEYELDRIFRHDWVYVARLDEIPNPGDWHAATIGGEAIMLVRGQDGNVRALSRVCPHRFMDVLGGTESRSGRSESFICPYHSWAFDLQGGLAGAPLMNRSARFEREAGSYCLREFATEVWHGFVFVNLDSEAAPLALRLGDAEEVVAPYRLEEWRYIGGVRWPESEANWKLVMDNGRECYHHQGAHKDSVEPLWPAHLVDADTTDSKHWFLQRLYVSREAAVGEDEGHLMNPLMLPALDGLNAWQRSHYALLGIYPNMFIAPGPDLMFIARWYPTAPTRHLFELGYAIHESQLDNPELEKVIAETHEWAHQIQIEDSLMITNIQKMLTSRATARGGALSHLERPVWQFQKYLAHRLAGANV